MNRALYALLLLPFACNGEALASESSAPKHIPQARSDASPDGEALAYEISPQRLAPAQWKTVVQTSHTATHLIVTVTAFDPEPLKLVAQEAKYDGGIGGDDSIIVSVAPQVEARRAYVFQVNAVGARADYVISSGGDSAPNWNGEWKGTARVTEFGYVTDFEIPFSSIGLELKAGIEARLGFNVERQIGRGRAERISLAPVNTNLPCIECQYTVRTLRVEKLAQSDSTTLRVQPYAIATSNRQTNALTGQLVASATDSDFGVDATWHMTPRDTLVATINPDFSQVEIDTIQFQINRRFVRSLPERRQFFTNESGIFSTNLPLLYTRTLVDPRAGGQYVRRRENYELAALWVEDEVTSFIRPSEETSSTVSLGRRSSNFASRVNYRPTDQLRTAVMATHRDAGAYRNSVASVDATWAASDRHQIDVQAVTSDTCDDVAGASGPSVRCATGSAGKIAHSFGGERWYTLADYTRYSQDFRADLGQIHQVGVWDAFATAGYQAPSTWLGLVERVKYSASYSRQESDESGLLSETSAVSASLSSKKASLAAQLDAGRQAFEDRIFSVSGGQLQWTHRITGRVGYSVSAGHRTAVDYTNLRLGEETTVSGTVAYKPSPKFDTRVSFASSTFDSAGVRAFSTQTVSVRAEYHFNTHHHLMALINGGVAEVNGARSESARYQVTYQYKPSAFQYFITGFSGAAQGGDRIDGLQPSSEFAFAKFVWDLNW